MNDTLIEWASKTWNPVTGCPGPKVSPGCANCYAERMANTRLRHVYARMLGEANLPTEGPFERMYFHYNRLDQPRRLKKPAHIFVCSMGDLFHDYCELAWIEEVFFIMGECPQQTFMLLTKRPERMAYAIEILSRSRIAEEHGWPLPNVWLGVTVCNQAEANAKIPVLAGIPAAKRFASIEPMLGPINLEEPVGALPEGAIECMGGDSHRSGECGCLPGLDWFICGGENGSHARPMHPEWVRHAQDRCARYDKPFFFKGWGAWLPTDQWLTNPSGESVCVYEDGSVSAAPEPRGLHHTMAFRVKRPESALFYGEKIHEVPS